jgi:hypothetical protein
MDESTAKTPRHQAKIEPRTRSGLHAEFNRFCEEHPAPEGLIKREWRLYWTNGRLAARRQRSVESWNDLSQGQAKYLLKALAEKNGSRARYRAMKIAEMACDLWGGQAWDDSLRARLGERFHLQDPRDLSAGQAYELMEELISRIARRDGVGIEEVRRRFKKAEGRKQKAEMVAQGPLSGPAVLCGNSEL